MLRGVGFGGGDTDFRSGLGEQRGVAFADEAAAGNIANREGLAAHAAGHADRGEGVGGFAGLRNRYDKGIGTDLRVAVAEFAGDIDFHRDIRKVLDEQLAIHAGMAGGAAGNDHDAVQAAQVTGIKRGQVYLHGAVVHMTLEELAKYTRLLVDFLQHESFEAGFFGGFGAEGDGLDVWFNRSSVEFGDGNAIRPQYRDLAVIQINHLLDPAENGGDIAGDEVFALADTDDERTAEASGDDLVGFVGRENAHGVGSASAGERLAGGIENRAPVVAHRLADEMGNDFGVGFRLEGATGGDQSGFEFLVVFDDAVVDDGDTSGPVEVRVGVALGGFAMGGPAGVADATGGGELDRLNFFL